MDCILAGIGTQRAQQVNDPLQSAWPDVRWREDLRLRRQGGGDQDEQRLLRDFRAANLARSGEDKLLGAQAEPQTEG